LLVCAGDRHGTSLSIPVPDGTKYPRVVFGLRPQLGESIGWVDSADMTSPTSPVAFDKCLMPKSAVDGRFRHAGQRGKQAGGRQAILRLVLTYPSAGLTIHIDGQGRIFSVDPSDGYKNMMDAEELLPSGRVRLEEVPRVGAETTP
jgi:hypothetical protein